MAADESQEELRVTVFDKKKNNGRGVVHKQKRKHMKQSVSVGRGPRLASSLFCFASDHFRLQASSGRNTERERHWALSVCSPGGCGGVGWAGGMGGGGGGGAWRL